jgi:hypothetical protein
MRVDREAIVQHDQRVRQAVRFDVHDVAQRELEMMHAVDEGEVDRPPEQRARTLRGEKGIARHLEQVARRLAPRFTLPHVAPEAEARIDRDADAARQRQGLAGRGADFQIGLRPLHGVQPAQQLEIARPGVLGPGEGSVGMCGCGHHRGANLEKTAADCYGGPAPADH